MRTTSCYTDEEIAAYVNGLMNESDSDGIRLHIETCNSCATDSTVVGALKRHEVWAPDDPPRTGDGVNATVRAVVHQTLQRPASMWHERLRSEPRLRTHHAVREMLRCADEESMRKPSHAREIYELAATTVEDICSADDNLAFCIAELRVDVWREVADARRRGGAYEAALEALRHADTFTATCHDPSYYAALVAFVRALVLTDAERTEEAMDALLFARSDFSASDLTRYTKTFWQEAIIHHRRGDIDRAIATFETLIDETKRSGDERAESDLYGNIAWCWAGTKNYMAACDYLARSIAIDRRLGSRVSELRNAFTLGKMLASAGRVDEAAEHFAATRDSYITEGMGASALRVEMHRADALLRAGRHAELVEALNSVVARATEYHMSITAADAMARLRDLAVSELLIPESFTYAERYLSEIQTSPEMPFRPPTRAS